MADMDAQALAHEALDDAEAVIHELCDIEDMPEECEAEVLCGWHWCDSFGCMLAKVKRLRTAKAAMATAPAPAAEGGE